MFNPIIFWCILHRNYKYWLMGVLLWVILSIIVGGIGGNRKIGFLGAFLCSLLLSPVVGIIIVLISGEDKEALYQNDIMEMQKKQQKTLMNLQQTANVNSTLNELERLKKLTNDGTLSEDEFNTLKQKVLSKTVVENIDYQDFEFQIKMDDNSLIYYNEEMRIEGDCIHFLIFFSDGIGGDVWGNESSGNVAIKHEEEFIYYIDKAIAIKAEYIYQTTGELIPDGRI